MNVMIESDSRVQLIKVRPDSRLKATKQSGNIEGLGKSEYVISSEDTHTIDGAWQ